MELLTVLMEVMNIIVNLAIAASAAAISTPPLAWYVQSNVMETLNVMTKLMSKAALQVPVFCSYILYYILNIMYASFIEHPQGDDEWWHQHHPGWYLNYNGNINDLDWR